MTQVSSLKTGIRYKNTPIGKIPVDWEVGRLGDLCIGEAEYGANVPSMDNDNNLPRYVRITDITDNGKLSESSCQSIDKGSAQPYILGEGEFLFARSGATVGKTYLYREKDGECAFAGYLIRFKPDPNHLLPKFLFHFTHSDYYYNWVKGILRAGAQPNINAKEYSNMLLPKPPIGEQKRITEILTTVDEAIDKTDQIIEKTKEVKKGLMQRLLTRGIGHKKFKKTEIGEIPVEWEVGKISNYGEIVTGNTPPTNVPEYYGSEYPFVSPFDLGSKKTIVKTGKYLSKEGFSVSRSLPPNSVLVVCIGSTIGKTGIAGTELATNQQINSIICKSSDNNFVYYYTTFINQQFKQLAGTQAVPILNKGNFSKVKVAIPPLHEQKEIGSILSAIDGEIEKETNHKDQLELLKKGLMQVLLTGKIRVSLETH